MQDYHYEKAQKKVKAKKGFYTHLGIYIAIGLFFFGVNMMTIFDGDPELWFMYPLLPWGAGLLIHYFGVFGLPWIGNMDDEWEEKEIEKELRKIKRKEGYVESREEEFESLELPERAIIKEKYRDNDLV